MIKFEELGKVNFVTLANLENYYFQHIDDLQRYNTR